MENEKVLRHDEILKRAMEWAKENKPDSSQNHKAAFANSVAYLVTGASGGYGGPSVREHAVTRACMFQGKGKEGPPVGVQMGKLAMGEIQSYYCDPEWDPGLWQFSDAVKFAEPIVFGPLGDLHRWCCKNEHCFDDDPKDIEVLESEN